MRITFVAWKPLAVLACLMLALFARVAGAQQGSGIAGTVRDPSGAGMAGVTVEAASPALIERARIAVTDAQGRYNLVDLRPGTYVVTFSQAGFSTFRRENIQLTSGFTATADAQLSPGDPTEVVVESGGGPSVDRQNVRDQTVLAREAINTLPTSVQHWNSLVNASTGFSGRTEVTGQYQGLNQSFHGKTGTNLQYDGMGVNHPDNGSTGFNINSTTVQEMVRQTSGIGAEVNADGAVMNMIPLEGGNAFSGSLSGLWTGESLGSDNLTDELRGRGLTTVSKILEIYDATATLGGPIKRDRLWFFTSQREWGNRHQLAGIFWNATQGTPFYTPDPARPADRYQWYESHAVRLTWQASRANRLNFFVDISDTCQCRSSGALRGDAPEAATAYHNRPAGLYQASWAAPISAKLLLEAAAGVTIFNWPSYLAPGVEPDHISMLEQSTGLRFNAAQFYFDRRQSDRPAQRASASYVTGAHLFKIGVHNEQGISNYLHSVHGDVDYTLRNGVPVSLTQHATPYLAQSRVKRDMGIYIQDRWAIHDRLTLNLGLRYDNFNAYIPAQHVPAGQFLGERSYDRLDDVPNWTNLNPRLGAAYDVTGNGRTAFKVSIGRYPTKTPLTFTNTINPIRTTVNEVSRAWNDGDRDYVPDCDLKNFGANGECGPVSNENFGQLNVTTRWADDVRTGSKARGYNWDLSTELAHEFVSGMTLTGGYYHNWFGDFRVTDNLSVNPEDFDPYCITAPVDPRLPGGGGYEVCGLYDLKPAKFGQVDNLVALASHYGKQTLVNDFFTVSFNARIGSGAQLGGGIDTGRTVSDSCFVVDSPQQLLYCRVVTAFGDQMEFKLNGSAPLPGGFVVSGVYQNTPGTEYTADYPATNAEIARSLGRNLSGGRRTATVPLVAPKTHFEKRFTRLDVRVTKLLRLTSRLRLQTNFDLYNALNSNSILQLRTAFGAQWRQPTSILDGRIMQFSARLTF